MAELERLVQWNTCKSKLLLHWLVLNASPQTDEPLAPMLQAMLSKCILTQAAHKTKSSCEHRSTTTQCTADLPDRICLTPNESDVKGDYFKLQSHGILSVSEAATAHLPNLFQARLQDYRHKIRTDNSKLRSPNACYFLTTQTCISGESDPAV